MLCTNKSKQSTIKYNGMTKKATVAYLELGFKH